MATFDDIITRLKAALTASKNARQDYKAKRVALDNARTQVETTDTALAQVKQELLDALKQDSVTP